MEQNVLKKQIALGVILIIIGISLFTKDYIANKREEVFSEMNIELTDLLSYKEEAEEPKQEPQEPEVETPPPTEEPKEETQPVVDYESYIGFLEISKINFSRGFYKKESNLNNVKFNIKILPQSNYPDEDKGNVIIIGHSGNYTNSYFANLHKLEKEDTAAIKYNGKTYTYKIVNIYTDTKDGTVTIYRDKTQNCLTLITCTKDSDTTQTIYIMELVSVE